MGDDYEARKAARETARLERQKQRELEAQKEEEERKKTSR